MPTKDKPDKSERQKAAENEAHSTEVAFEQIMDAILGAGPNAMREHRNKKRANKKKK